MSWHPKTVRADITKLPSVPMKAPRGTADREHLADMRKLQDNETRINDTFNDSANGPVRGESESV